MTPATSFHANSVYGTLGLANPAARRIQQRSFRHTRQGDSARERQGDTRDICFSDQVYASLTLGGRVIAEITRDGISNFSALLAMLRARVPSCQGLARLCVRNMTRGWRLERPLMLYAEPGAAAPRRPMPWETH